MKRLILLTLPMVFATYSVAAQNLKLHLNNPAPRVSDELGIEFLFSARDAVDQTDSVSSMGALGSVKLNQLRSDSGWVWIGPFSLTIAGIQYQTDSVHLWIAPDLPDLETGIWMRQVESDGRQLLILEQRMPLKEKITNSKDGSAQITWESGDEDFASIDQESLEGTGVMFDFKYSQSKQQSVKVKGGNAYHMVYYKYSVYEIHTYDGYNGKLELKKKHFSKFPSGVPLETLIIR